MATLLSELMSLGRRPSTLSAHFHRGAGTTFRFQTPQLRTRRLPSQAWTGTVITSDFQIVVRIANCFMWTHGRLVNYDQPNPAEPVISSWLTQNPQRLNLGRVGFWFDPSLNITKKSLSNKSQTLDLYSGLITSQFTVLGSDVQVQVAADPDSDTVSIQIDSELIQSGKFEVFFDFPYSDVNKFDVPFVGIWNSTSNSLHKTSLQQSENQAKIRHDIGSTTYYTSIKWETDASISRPPNSTH